MAPPRSTCLLALLVGLLSAFTAGAQGKADQPVRIFPDQIKWDAQLPTGAQAAVLSGRLDKPGLYVQRVRLIPGGMVPPHTHPDTRNITVLSGELYVGQGETVDAGKSTKYPAGSFLVIPAGVVHYTWAGKGEVVYQESGIGPTATDFIKN